MKVKGLISLVLSAVMTLSLTTCSGQTVSSADASFSSADSSMGFDPADRVVRADSDIFSAAKCWAAPWWIISGKPCGAVKSSGTVWDSCETTA